MKPVPHCPGYLASDDGHVYRDGTQRKPNTNGRGYLKIKVSVNNVQWDEYIHRMVCAAYHGPCPDGMECRHLDGQRQNNRPANLEWSDKLTNEGDKRRHGTLNIGTFNGVAKLTPDLVVAMRDRARAGESIQAIAESLGLGRAVVGDAVCGRRWNHIPGALPPGSTRHKDPETGKWVAGHEQRKCA